MLFYLTATEYNVTRVTVHLIVFGEHVYKTTVH